MSVVAEGSETYFPYSFFRQTISTHLLWARSPHLSWKFLLHEIKRAPFIRWCTTKGVSYNDSHRSNGTVWKYPCYWENLWNTAYICEQVRTLRTADLEGCLVSCYFQPIYFLSLPTCVLALLGLEGVHKEELPPPLELESAQEGHRGHEAPVGDPGCSKISQVLRPPDGQRWAMLSTKRMTYRRERGACWLSRGAIGQVAWDSHEKWESLQGPPSKLTRLRSHDSTAAKCTCSASAAQELFPKRSASKSSKSDLLTVLHYVKNICKHSLPCLGIFHLELPKCLHSFWGCGKEVLGPQKWNFPAWWVDTNNAGSPGAHRAWLWESLWEAPGPTAKSPFPGQTNKHLPEECQKQKVECPSEVSKPPDSWWISTPWPGPCAAAALTSHDLELQQEVNCLILDKSVNVPGLSCSQKFATVFLKLWKPLNT